MCRVSRRGNFSALSLWILQVHSPELLSLSPSGKGMLCFCKGDAKLVLWFCFVVFFFSSLFRAISSSSPSKDAVCRDAAARLLTGDVPGLQGAAARARGAQPSWALLLLLPFPSLPCWFVCCCCCCCCFQPPPSPRAAFARVLQLMGTDDASGAESERSVFVYLM